MPATNYVSTLSQIFASFVAGALFSRIFIFFEKVETLSVDTHKAIEKKSQTDGRAKKLIVSPSKKLSKKERREQNSKSTVWLTCKIIVAKKESSYRKAVIDSINKQDCVLEIGCHVGVTTALVAKLAKFSYGIDSSEYSINMAKKRHLIGKKSTNLLFFCVDAFDQRSVLKHLTGTDASVHVDVILIDISGNREPSLVLRLLESYDRIFSPRLFIIKNFKLHNFVELSDTTEN